MKTTLRILSLIATLAIFLQPNAVRAISEADKKAVNNDTVYYDPGFQANNCSGSSGQPGPVVLIGDSLSVGMQQHGIEDKFKQAGWQPAVDAVVSRPLQNLSFKPYDGLGAITTQAQVIKTATAVVMELGTNPSGANFAQQVTTAVNAIHALNATAVVYWVNVGAVTNPVYGQYNKALNDLAGPNNFKVINWFESAYPGQDPFNINTAATSQYIPAGNVHPNPAGYDAMVNLVFQTVTGGATQAKPASTPPPTPNPSAKIPQDTMLQIIKLRPLYQQAAQQTNVPWQLLAAMHYREHGNSQDNPGNGDGPYQIVSNNYPPGPIDDATFVKESVDAANFIRGKQNSNTPAHRVPLNASFNDPEVIKDYLFSYNGRSTTAAQIAASLGFNAATQPYEGSAYVMNQFDAVHTNMPWLGGTDTRLGAFTVYAQLVGLGGNALCSQ